MNHQTPHNLNSGLDYDTEAEWSVSGLPFDGYDLNATENIDSNFNSDWLSWFYNPGPSTTDLGTNEATERDIQNLQNLANSDGYNAAFQVDDYLNNHGAEEEPSCSEVQVVDPVIIDLEAPTIDPVVLKALVGNLLFKMIPADILDRPFQRAGSWDRTGMRNQ